MSFGTLLWEALCECRPLFELSMSTSNDKFAKKWSKWRSNMHRQMVSKFRLLFELSPDSDNSSLMSPLAYVRFGSKADMCSARDDVCYGPIADIRPVSDEHGGAWQDYGDFGELARQGIDFD